MDQKFLLGGGDPCLCDIEQLTGELPPKKRLSTWHLECDIVKTVLLQLRQRKQKKRILRDDYAIPLTEGWKEA